MNKMNRRTLLKYAGAGLAAGVLSDSIGKVMASSPSDKVKSSGAPGFTGKIPFSLIVDDGSPVDRYFMNFRVMKLRSWFLQKFTKRVADTFDRFDLHGKFTIIPMPSCLGRIDQSLKRVPQDHLSEFLN